MSTMSTMSTMSLVPFLDCYSGKFSLTKAVQNSQPSPTQQMKTSGDWIHMFDEMLYSKSSCLKRVARHRRRGSDTFGTSFSPCFWPPKIDLMKLSGIQAVFRLSTLHIKANSSPMPGGNMPKDNDNYQLAPPTSTPSLRCSISMPMISVSCSRIFMASHLYISIGTDITCQTTGITCQNKHASGSQKFRNILQLRFISLKTKLQLQLSPKLLVFITRACNVSCPSQPPKMYMEWP